MSENRAAGMIARSSDGLIDRVEESGELAPTAGAAEAQHDVQGAMVLARRFPRDETNCYARIMRACERKSFAEDAVYSFPRGGQTVSGPSVNLAREAARIWGNIRWGLKIVSDTEESRHIRGWAWDLESNARIESEDDFSKRVYRKGKDGQAGSWKDVSTDEREMRELTNRRGAICVRNCLLQIMPKDFVEDAVARVYQTMASGVAADPDGERKRIAEGFLAIGVQPEQVGTYLGKPMAEANPQELASLKAVLASIRDGNSKWSEYVAAKDAGVQMPRANAPAPATMPQAAASAMAVQAPAQQPVTQQPQGGSGATRKISEKQAKLLFAVSRGSGWDPQDMKDYVKEKLGCSVDDIQPQDFQNILDFFKTTSA